MVHRLLFDETIWLDEMRHVDNGLELVCLAWRSAVARLSEKKPDAIKLVTSYRFADGVEFELGATKVRKFDTHFEIVFRLDMDHICQTVVQNNEVLDFHIAYRKKKTRLSGPIWQNGLVFSNQGYDFLPYSTNKTNFVSVSILRKAAQQAVASYQPGSPSVIVFTPTLKPDNRTDVAMVALAHRLSIQGFNVCITAIRINPAVKMLDVARYIHIDYIDCYTFKSGNKEEASTFTGSKKHIGRQTTKRLARYLENISVDIFYLADLDSNIYDFFIEHTKDSALLIVGDLDLNRLSNSQSDPAYLTKPEADSPHNRYFRHAARQFDAVHVSSRFMQTALANVGAAHVFTIPSASVTSHEALDLNKILLRRTVQAVGPLDKRSKMNEVIEAFSTVARVGKQFDDWKLEIIGAGPMREDLEGQALNNGLSSRITVAPPKDGTATKDDVAIYIAAGASEVMSSPLLNAMASGSAILAYDSVPEKDVLLAHNQTAVLVASGDVNAMAVALQNMILKIENYDAEFQHIIITAHQVAGRLTDEAVGTMWRTKLYELINAKRANQLPPRPRTPFSEFEKGL